MIQTIGENRASPYLQRKIQCPGHWLIPPTIDVYLRRPVELLKNVKDFIEFRGVKIKMKKTAIVKDRFGRKVLDWKKLYELKRKGIVLQPFVTAAWAIENVYDPKSLLCAHCDKRCKDGQGNILINTIRRLIGEKSKRR